MPHAASAEYKKFLIRAPGRLPRLGAACATLPERGYSVTRDSKRLIRRVDRFEELDTNMLLRPVQVIRGADNRSSAGLSLNMSHVPCGIDFHCASYFHVTARPKSDNPNWATSPLLSFPTVARTSGPKRRTTPLTFRVVQSECEPPISSDRVSTYRAGVTVSYG